MAAALLASACGRQPPPARQERKQTLEGLTLSQSDKGQPAWSLHSREATILEDSDMADLDAPAMDFYREGKLVSRVTSKTGTVQTVTHDVRLSTSVVLDSFEDHSRLFTEVLLYSSKTGLFHTDEDVKIERPEGVIYGKGMEGTPDLSEIRIFHQHSVLSGKTAPAHP